jgi:pyrimidine dimer DNA glycosylase
MRLWSIHPRYLDTQGLTALWREALLARAVLRGLTRGYRRHPQLHRFRDHPAPRAAISTYLRCIHAEAGRRGYAFDGGKIGTGRTKVRIPVSAGQLAHEWRHLMRKLARRNPSLRHAWRGTARPQVHPLMRRRVGPIEHWERGPAGGGGPGAARRRPRAELNPSASGAVWSRAARRRRAPRSPRR